MGTSTLLNQFRIDYPYYGLFRTADIEVVQAEGDVLFQCKNINGTVIWLKKTAKSQRWLDANVGNETPLATIIGMYIDDHIRRV
jgi:hypothetical protein